MTATFLRAALGIVVSCVAGADPVLAQSPGTPAQTLQSGASQSGGLSGSASDAVSGSPGAGNPRANSAGVEGPSAAGSTTTAPSGSSEVQGSLRGTLSTIEQLGR
jgi:hypothetical protein